MNVPVAAADAPRFAVIGLGYVGLPLAVAFGRHWPTLGFDIDAGRIAELRNDVDHTLEMEADELASAQLLELEKRRVGNECRQSSISRW